MGDIFDNHHIPLSLVLANSQARLSAMLTPPYHFAIVASPLVQGCQDTAAAAAADTSHILYRGALPAVRNAPFVRRLGIRTLVCLRKKPLKEDDAFSRWVTRRGIDVKWIKAETMGEETLGMERAEVSEALQVLLNPAAYPIYLADTNGNSHTTLIVACLRKLQGWHSESIVSEIYRFEPDHDDFPLVPFITSYLSTSGPSKDEPGAVLALPPPPYPSWLWPAQPATPSATPSQPSERERERERPTLSKSASASQSSSTGPLPFPNPLTARRHPSMRLTFAAAPPPPAPLPTPKGTTPPARTPSSAPLARVSTTDRRVISPRETTTREDSAGSVGGAGPAASAAADRNPVPKVSFTDSFNINGVMTRSPVTMMGSSATRWVPPNKSSTTSSSADDELVMDPDDDEDENELGNLDDEPANEEEDDEEDDGQDDEDEDDEEEEEDDEDEDDDDEDEEDDDDDEPSVSQYISALDLAGFG